MPSKDNIADCLSELADQEFASAKAQIDQLQFPRHLILLIEICRVLDYHHVLQVFSRNPANKLPVPDFDIMVRGWNPAVALLLSHYRVVHGIPLMESTPESQRYAMALLHQLGRFSLLKQEAEMIRHGMTDGELVDDRIVLRMSSRTSTDHFLDRIDEDKLRHLQDKMKGSDPTRQFLGEHRIDDLDARIEALVFPWRTGRGTMIGYQAEQDIDYHFLALVTKETLDWRNEAGIHPDAKIDDVSGSDLTAIGLLLTSVYLKHIRFVDVGKRKVPDANYAMSLTIWKPRAELTSSICEFTGMAERDVSATLDLFTLKHDQYEYFATELTPFIPMLIEISDEYLLSPVSSIFRNPFHGIRMLQERRASRTEESLREPREKWMTSDLCHLFLGDRYRIRAQPIRLKRKGNTVTDIDAAVLDVTKGELALFQLKWQDFSTNEIRKQRSKAKNFVDQVDTWAEKVEMWINECGIKALFKSLRLKTGALGPVPKVRLFAIGRSASRFRSYGFTVKSGDLAVCSWPQFVRLRYEVGPADNVVQSLHERIQTENAYPINKQALPHEMIAAGQRISFEDLWNLYGDEDDR
jgi:hypothetical protein